MSTCLGSSYDSTPLYNALNVALYEALEPTLTEDQARVLRSHCSLGKNHLIAIWEHLAQIAILQLENGGETPVCIYETFDGDPIETFDGDPINCF